MEITKIIHFIIQNTNHYLNNENNLEQSLNVLHFTNDIYQKEIIKNPLLKNKKNIIFISSLLYVIINNNQINKIQEIELLNTINFFLKREYNEILDSYEINSINKIITTISYSYVILNGYTNFDDDKELEISYHIVRESNLLSGYDFNKCLNFTILKNQNLSFKDNFEKTETIFKIRILNYIEKNLFILEYSKKIANYLHKKSIKTILKWKILLNYF